MGLDRCFFILKLSINEVSKCKQSKVHLLPVTYSLSAELSFKTHFHSVWISMSDKQKVCSLSPDRRREVVFICLYVASRFCVQLTDGGWGGVCCRTVNLPLCATAVHFFLTCWCSSWSDCWLVWVHPGCLLWVETENRRKQVRHYSCSTA